MQTKNADIIVVGGGIIGCSLAYYLARRKARVILLEKASTGFGASGGAAGMLGVQSEPFINEDLWNASVESRRLYGELAGQFLEESGVDIHLEQRGLLHAAFSDEERRRLWQASRHGDALFGPAENLGPEDLRRRCPCVEGETAGGVFYPADGQVLSPRVTEAFRRGAEKAGARVMENEEVLDFLIDAGRLAGVKTARQEYRAERVLLAAGPWTESLARKLGLCFSIEPVRGQLLFFETPQRFLDAPVLFGDTGLYVVPKEDGHLYAGTTVESAGFDARPTDSAFELISEAITGLIPRVAHLPYKGAWAGLRPGTPDGLPFLGPVPDWDNLWVAAGHFRRGILLAPFTGKTMAEWILRGRTEASVGAFDPGRFTKTEACH